MFLLILFFTFGDSIGDVTMASDIPFLPESYPSCFTEGKTWDTEEVLDTVTGIHSLYSCQDLCVQSPNCHGFTWYDDQASQFHFMCFLYDFPITEFSCTNCVSGPQSCICSGYFSCQFTGHNFIDQLAHVDTEILCQKFCLDADLCRFYTWLDDTSEIFPNECFLFSSCDEKVFACDSCHSGLGDCRNISVITSTTTSTTIFPSTTSIPSSSSTPTSTTTTPPIPSTSSTPTSNTTTPPISSCDIPEQPKHGNWFCPPSGDPFSLTCHLECYSGYVSNSKTVITCHNGVWTSSPTCVEAIALITGRSSPAPSNTVEIYGEGLHQRLPNLPEARGFHSLDLVNSLVLLCGGVLTNTSCLVMNSSQQWIPHSNTIMGRFLHASVSMLGRLHLMGGFNKDSTTEYLAPPEDQWHLSWDLHQFTDSACATKIQAQVLITIGGGFVTGMRTVMSYNVTSGAATRLQDLITGRAGHGCVYVNEPSTGLGRVLVAGGYTGGEYLSSSEMYNIATGKWATMGQLTTERRGVRMVVLGGNVLAMGGYNGGALSSVDRFNKTTNKWMAAENMMEEREGYAVTAIHPNLVGIWKN